MIVLNPSPIVDVNEQVLYVFTFIPWYILKYKRANLRVHNHRSNDLDGAFKNFMIVQKIIATKNIPLIRCLQYQD